MVTQHEISLIQTKLDKKNTNFCLFFDQAILHAFLLRPYARFFYRSWLLEPILWTSLEFKSKTPQANTKTFNIQLLGQWHVIKKWLLEKYNIVVIFKAFQYLSHSFFTELNTILTSLFVLVLQFPNSSCTASC